MGITPFKFTHSEDSCGFLLTYIMLLHISSWMTTNRLTLNSAKTEFPFIGLKQKLGKIHNTSLNTETQQNQQKYFKKNIEHVISACRGGGPIF